VQVAAETTVEQARGAGGTAVAAEPAKPAKKVGRFKAWLNADQPPKKGDATGQPADDPARRGADAGDA
jgi:hypothetical protein